MEIEAELEMVEEGGGGKLETVGMVGFASMFRWESEQTSGGERAICSRRWRVHQRAVRGALTNKMFFLFPFYLF